MIMFLFKFVNALYKFKYFCSSSFRSSSTPVQSLRARTEKALVKNDDESRLVIKQILSFTLNDKVYYTFPYPFFR